MRVAVIFFLLTATVSIWFAGRSEQHRTAERRNDLRIVVASHANAIQLNIDRALSSTYALAALLRENRGDIPGFDALATQMLPYYQGASALALAPGGVVRRIVPLAGNEKAIGHDLLKDPARDKEAIKARETRQLTLAGPFKLVQGGFAAAGRLPVYIDDGKGSWPFWGFVSVLIRFPDTLEPARLPELVARGYDYELWRIHPDSGEKQVIAASSSAPLHFPVDQAIAVPNAIWTLSVAPRAGWQENGVLAAKMLLGILISGIVASLANTTTKLRRHRAELESQVEKRTRELRESEERFRTLVESIENIGVQGYDRRHRVIFWNTASESMYGFRRDEALGQPLEDLIVPPSMRSQVSLAIDHWIADGVAIPAGELTMQRKDGRPVQVYSSHTLQTNSHGEPELYSVDIDLTARYEAEARMREALVVFNASSQGIVTTDAAGVITAVNPAFTVITGYPADEVIGATPAVLRSGRHDAAFYRAMWSSLLSTGQWVGEIWNRRRSGEIYPQWLNISAVRDPQGQVSEYVALFSDITERKRQEEVIWQQANFDALTGLANRNLLADRLERAISQAKRNDKKVGLIFLDLDGFKWVNDTLGHDVGDELLIEVANRLRACVREEDTAARLGGDEFTLVIHGLAAAEDMLALGEKVVAVLHEPFPLRGNQHQLSGSLGITIYPDDGEDVQTLLKNADIAMYKAKQGGKNRYQFYARHMQVDAQARMQLEADLRSALAEQAFVMHYQPIVDADSGELVGAEALVRWQHAERGMVSPLDFIPVAEDCGLIVPLGEWILRETARQWRDWRNKGHRLLKLSVNVSSVQFREASLSELIAGILREYDIAPGHLVLEITESVLMDGSPEAEARMRAIKALGVGYSLDDFGTGFSSLSYLKRFPVDVVKIDRSFVNDCPDDRNDAHLVEAIINMAHSLELKVTAEGVETDDQLEFLRDLGCDTLQGYLVGRPLPAEAFEVLIQRHQLLLPTDGASLEESRLLAALRQDELDVDAWVRRLLGERSPAMAAYRDQRSWISQGLDLRQTIEAHLDWRRRLDDLIASGKPGNSFSVEDAGAADRCLLGRWLQDRPSDDPCFARLDRAHREFHALAGQIVANFAHGRREMARRSLAGIRFRRMSRDVVIALIDCYRSDAITTTTTTPES